MGRLGFAASLPDIGYIRAFRTPDRRPLRHQIENILPFSNARVFPRRGFHAAVMRIARRRSRVAGTIRACGCGPQHGCTGKTWCEKLRNREVHHAPPAKPRISTRCPSTLGTVTTLPSDARTTIPTGREPGIAHVPVIHARSSEVARSHITPGPSKP